MSLATKLGLSSLQIRVKKLYSRYGLLENPFPPASQSMGHPHMETPADDVIVQHIRSFLDEKKTQVLVVEGQQGYGKTNLLEYYKNELAVTFAEAEGYYIIRYYPDPEPDFGKVVQRIVQEFGTEHLKKLGEALAAKWNNAEERKKIVESIRGYETRQAFISLAEAALTPANLDETARLLFEYLLGMRPLKSHVNALGVQFRLDTTESKTQALHDLIYLSNQMNCLEGLFLFMDELEKVGAFPLQQVVRYLSAIRALIDALPKHLFLLMAMTPAARDQYTRIFPALAGRLQEPLSLTALSSESEALHLYEFYVANGRTNAQKNLLTQDWISDFVPPLSTSQIKDIYAKISAEGRRRGDPGVTPRAFLHSLHAQTEEVFAGIR